MTIKTLKQIHDTAFINLRALCDKAKINYRLIRVKLHRDTELTDTEAQQLSETLKAEIKVIQQLSKK